MGIKQKAAEEPVVIINSVVAFIEAGIALWVGFGLDLTQEQIGLLMAFVIAGANVIKTYVGRTQVTPNCKVLRAR